MYSFIKQLLKPNRPFVERRSTPLVGPKPQLGGYIAKEDVAMKVIGPLTTEQWQWFLLNGWREVDVKTNRRAYFRLPKESLERITNADPTEREKVYTQILQSIRSVA